MKFFVISTAVLLAFFLTDSLVSSSKPPVSGLVEKKLKLDSNSSQVDLRKSYSRLAEFETMSGRENSSMGKRKTLEVEARESRLADEQFIMDVREYLQYLYRFRQLKSKEEPLEFIYPQQAGENFLPGLLIFNPFLVLPKSFLSSGDYCHVVFTEYKGCTRLDFASFLQKYVHEFNSPENVKNLVSKVLRNIIIGLWYIHEKDLVHGNVDVAHLTFDCLKPSPGDNTQVSTPMLCCKGGLFRVKKRSEFANDNRKAVVCILELVVKVFKALSNSSAVAKEGNSSSDNHNEFMKYVNYFSSLQESEISELVVDMYSVIFDEKGKYSLFEKIFIEKHHRTMVTVIKPFYEILRTISREGVEIVQAVTMDPIKSEFKALMEAKRIEDAKRAKKGSDT